MAAIRIESVKGFGITEFSSITASNTVLETALISANILGGSMGINRSLKFEVFCFLTTPVVAPNLTLTIKFGGSSLTIGGVLSLATLQSGKPFMIKGIIGNKGLTNSQVVYGEIKQYAPLLPILLSSGGGLEYADWNVDTTVDQPFSVTSQFGSAVLGSAIDFRYATLETS